MKINRYRKCGIGWCMVGPIKPRQKETEGVSYTWSEKEHSKTQIQRPWSLSVLGEKNHEDIMKKWKGEASRKTNQTSVLSFNKTANKSIIYHYLGFEIITLVTVLAGADPKQKDQLSHQGRDDEILA